LRITRKNQILRLLYDYRKSGDPSSVEIARELGLDPRNVSNDLITLRQWGFVEHVKRGAWRIKEKGIRVLKFKKLID